MTGFTRHHRSILRGALLISLLFIPALLVGCKNKGSDGSKGPSTGAAITGTAQNGLFRLSVNINPNTIPPGGSAGITVLATTLNGAPLDNRSVQMATTGGTLSPVAGKTDAAGKFVTSISIEETFTGGSSVEVSAIVDGLTAKATLFINEPGALKVVPSEVTLAPRDTVSLTCVGGVEPVRWEATGGTLNRHNERTVIYTAGSATGTFFAKCTDAGNNSATAEIKITSAVGDKLTVTPDKVTLRPGQSQNFQASGGRPPYTWSFPAVAGTLSNTTGPTTTLTAATGTTQPLSTASRASRRSVARAAVDFGKFTLLLTDSVGATASAEVTIQVEELTLNPSEVTFTANASPAGPTGTCNFGGSTAQFTVSGGVPLYKFSNAFANLGSIDQNGLYTAKSTTIIIGTFNDVVTVVDSFGTQVSAKVNFVCNLTAP